MPTSYAIVARYADETVDAQRALEQSALACAFCNATGADVDATGVRRSKDAMRTIYMPCESGLHFACGDCAKTKSKLVETVEARRAGGACHLKCLGAGGTCRSNGIFPPPKMPAAIIALNNAAKSTAKTLEDMRDRALQDQREAEAAEARAAAEAALLEGADGDARGDARDVEVARRRAANRAAAGGTKRRRDCETEEEKEEWDLQNAAKKAATAARKEAIAKYAPTAKFAEGLESLARHKGASDLEIGRVKEAAFGCTECADDDAESEAEE